MKSFHGSLNANESISSPFKRVDAVLQFLKLTIKFLNLLFAIETLASFQAFRILPQTIE